MKRPRLHQADRPNLADVLSVKLLQEMAGAGAFERGKAYFDQGRVVSLDVDRWLATAQVEGNELYRVRLWVDGTLLQFHCTCPAYEDGWFCKHCVAAGLAVMEQGQNAEVTADRVPRGGGERQSEKRNDPVDLPDVAAYLSGLDKTRLVDLILTVALRDGHLLRQLRFEASRQLLPQRVAATLHRAVDELFGPYPGRGDASATDLARQLGHLVDEMTRLCDEDHAGVVIEVAERALRDSERALEYVDDSDGVLGDELDRLQRIHHTACMIARPDPVQLARRLFEGAMRGGGYTAFGSPKAYADVLGEAGLEEYQRLARVQWEQVPALGPGDKDVAGFPDRYRLVTVMEELAELSGDIEALVAVKRRDLSTPARYLNIAETYRHAGRPEKALEWAEAGLRTFGKDWRLRDFVADEYHRLGRHDDAVALVWAAFAETPGFRAYQELRKHAERGGQWFEWRDRALKVARERLGAADGAGARRRVAFDAGWPVFTDSWGGSVELVRILLAEGLVEEAWERARRDACPQGLWLELASRREREHPGDAVKVYQACAELLIAQTHNAAYEEAAELVKRIRGLMGRMGREEDFREYLTALRASHGRKRNLRRLLPER
ncbi:MAG: DUF6880 family protein [Bacillota bacterium]